MGFGVRDLGLVREVFGVWGSAFLGLWGSKGLGLGL